MHWNLQPSSLLQEEVQEVLINLSLVLNANKAKIILFTRDWDIDNNICISVNTLNVEIETDFKYCCKWFVI